MPFSKMLRISICMLLLMSSLSSAKAQPPFNPMNMLDSTLRAVFSPLWHPVPGPGFLFEMSSNMYDSLYYTDNNPDTINRDIWFKLYEEMRKKAYDTTTILRHDTVFYRGHVFNKDTVVINIMAYNYLSFNDSALTTNHYYDFDTVNNTITDKFPGESDPFVTKRIFASSPLVYQLPYDEVTYRIDEEFLFHDQYNDFVINNWQIEIDFGDGMGWQSFPPPMPGAPHHYTAKYNSSGKAYIQTRIFDPIAASYIMTSIAEVDVPSRAQAKKPDSHIYLPWLTAGVYNPCSESGGPLQKIVIYVEGYDPGDFTIFGNRTASDIYGQMIRNKNIDELLNFGYTFVVVDWKQSGRDIKDNAAELIKLIDHLKCLQQITADTGTGEQFVIIGESMGGLVARYAMCFMEQNWQVMPGCLREKMHNTRLLITFDTPHDGVNIPLAYQHLFRDAGTFLLGTNTITQQVTGGLSNLLLDAKSVKQMLLYHVDTRHPFNHTYSEHPDRTLFKSDLLAVGNYPQYAKLFAMSNGSLVGRGQTRYYDGVDRQANDYILQMTSDSYAKFMGNDIQLLGTNFELHTVPQGSGVITTNNIDYYIPTFKIRLVRIKWWLPPVPQITVGSRYFTTFGYTKQGNNMEPYDVIPGSTDEQFNLILNKDYSGVKGIFYAMVFGFNQPTYSPTSHAWTVSKSAGGGMFGSSKSTSMYTDGFNTCFVPVFSSLDYNISNYWEDIENTPIGTKVLQTPFHVITGITEDYAPMADLPRLNANAFDSLINANVFRYNKSHLTVRNEALGSWDSNGTVYYTLDSSHRYFRYDTCLGNPNPGIKYLLNREIGDDTLLVDNREIKWTAIYDAELYIGVNESGDYYEYPTATGSQLIFPGVYSKEDPFIISGGHTIFKARGSNVIINGTYPNAIIDSINWIKCCEDPSANKLGKPEIETEKKSALRYYNRELPFSVYPNPISGNELIVTFNAVQDPYTKLMMYDAMGKLVYSKTIDITEPKSYILTIHTSDINISPGIYFVAVKNGNNTYKKTLLAK